VDSNERFNVLSRRNFIGYSILAACAAALEPVAALMTDRGWARGLAADDSATLVLDTMNGLTSFVVPGPDEYSIHQGVATAEPGGIDANIVEVLIAGIDSMQPPPPPFPSVSFMVATLLNNIALAVNPSPPGSFPSPFARLSFQEKVYVFAYMRADPSLNALAGLLPLYVGFLSYSEAGVFDPDTRTLTGQPVGWTLSGYEFAHGHDDFKGYYRNRRSVEEE
jgi:hypothetical protein